MAFAVAATGWLLLALALAGSGFCLHAGVAVGRYGGGRPVAAPASEPSVTLLKPLHGAEPGLREALLSGLAQAYGGAVEMRLGLQDAGDAALPLARALAGEDRRATVVLDPASHGANAKVSNLVNLERAGPLGELVVQSDSDIAVPPEHLRRLAAALEAPGAGLATCLYRGEAARPTLAARLGAMFVSYSGLPLFAVGVGLGATPCMGSTLALRRETLAAVGGFAAVKDVLADDYEMGVRVRALGLKTVVPPFLVVHRSSESTLGELWRHELRWSRTVADIDLAGHLGSVVTHPLPLALAGWALAGGAGSGLAVTALALAARLWLKGRVDAVARAGGAVAATGPWWLVPIRDMLSFAVFVAALAARRVDWRGARFHVGRGGELTPVRGGS